jgi:DNA repair protein RecN
VIRHIHIRDFAIIKRLDLALQPGMSVLTGETGAGKSILVDALGLALGDRAGGDCVRSGAERTEISVTFTLGEQEAAAGCLVAHDRVSNSECLIRRVIYRQGRSRAYIDGRPVPRQLLEELGELLINIHGQHEHQLLVQRETQRQLLDDFGGHGELAKDVARLYAEWKSVRAEWEVEQEAATAREDRASLLRYEIQELKALGLAKGEVERLEEEHKRLANGQRLLTSCHGAQQLLYEDDEASAHTLIRRALTELESLCELDQRLAVAVELLNTAAIQIQEGSDALRRYADQVDLDPERFKWVEQRLASIHELARKHRIAPQELPELLLKRCKELEALENTQLRLKTLQTHAAHLARDYMERAGALTARRDEAAATLAVRVSELIRTLGMPAARFEIVLERYSAGHFSPGGMESVEFRVSVNPGQPLKPLGKIASGGELSRISLGIQVVTARSARLPTLIFDEVDSGIGGSVAEVVGRALRMLGETTQVLCVTHLPQVAALAHHHLRVIKRSTRRSTITSVEALSAAERVSEIARMLGGIEITGQARAHAEELVQRAQSAS